MADAFCNSVLIVLLPLYVSRVPHYGIFADLPEELLVGILISLAPFMFALLQPAAAAVSDRVGRRKPFILGGLAVLALATLSYIPAESYRALAVLRMIQGVGIAFTIPTALALISDYADPGSVGASMGVFSTMRMIGFAVGPLVGGLIIESLGFKAAFVTGAAGALISLFLVMLYVPEIRSQPATARADPDPAVQAGGAGLDRWGNERAAVRAVLSQIWIVGGSVYVMAMAMSMIASVEAELNRRLDQTAVGFGIAFAAHTVALFLTQIPLGHLSDRIGRKHLIVIGLVAMAPLAILQGYAPTTFLLSADRFLLGIATAAITAPAYAMVADLALPGLKVRQMSILTMSFGMGVASGPVISGALAGILGFEVPFIFGGVLTAAAAGMVAMWVRESNPALA